VRRPRRAFSMCGISKPVGMAHYEFRGNLWKLPKLRVAELRWPDRVVQRGKWLALLLPMVALYCESTAIKSTIDRRLALQVTRGDKVGTLESERVGQVIRSNQAQSSLTIASREASSHFVRPVGPYNRLQRSLAAK
jgi:hypothetical protein